MGLAIEIRLNSDEQEILKNTITKTSLLSCNIVIPKTIEKCIDDNFQNDISIDDIIWLKTMLPDNIHFHKIIEKSTISLPKPKVEPRNPELEARIQRLKKEQNDKIYKEMTKNVDFQVRRSMGGSSFGYHVNEMNKQLIGVFSVFLSVAAGFVFGFFGLQLTIGPFDMAIRILFGIIAAIIIAIAELYFFIKKIEDDTNTDVKKKIQ